MRAVIVDTNVFVSGIFFSGPPHTILDAWRQGKLTLVASGAKVIASGDKALLKTSGYSGIEVLTPRAFVTRYLQ